MPSSLDSYDKKQLEELKDVRAPAVESDGKLEYVDQSGNIQTVATESFVTNRIGKIEACNAATTENLIGTYDNGASGVGATLTLSSDPLVVDGVSLTSASRVLVKNQTNPFENGVYRVSVGVGPTAPKTLHRVPEFDSPSQMIRGVTVPVLEGTLNSVSSWMLTSVVNTVGTSDISFSLLAKEGLLDAVGTPDQIEVIVIDDVAHISIAANPVLPGDTTINSTGYLKLPVGTTAQRPSTPATGMLRFNTSL